MYVNKKLGRLKQWAGEKMGSEVKTSVSDDFKSMEMEMSLRQEGMERLSKSMNSYIKTLSKRSEGEDRDKMPVSHLGQTMVSHGEDFEDDSEFGQCLQSMGKTNERIGRIQETYVQDANQTWLESLERSLAQMKEYNAARKKLESRRLAYDAAQAKIQRSKKDEFKMEDELRSARAKYEESCEDVYRRMEDIKEAEADSIMDLGSFVDAELRYYDRCRDVLLSLRQNWPGREPDPDSLSRQNSRYDDHNGDRAVDARPAIRSQRVTSNSYGAETSPAPTRPGAQRASTFDGPRQLRQEEHPPTLQQVSRIPSDSVVVKAGRDRLRNTYDRPAEQHSDLYTDPSDDSTPYGSPDRSFKGRPASPATSYGSSVSRKASSINLENSVGVKKPPPPPPPSRKTKPPPPPPPMKRSALATTNVSYA